MSRVGKKAIDIPKDVSITINQDKITVKGKNGTLERTLVDLLNYEIIETKIVITRKNETKKYFSLIRRCWFRSARAGLGPAHGGARHDP